MAGAREDAGPVVRPRSSHRKQRNSETQRAALEPSQDRSRRRNELILDAAYELLKTVNVEDLSHSDIANVAGVSKASVHYHFPTIAAIQLQLGRRLDGELSDYANQFRDHRDASSWQDVVRASARRARDWFNDRRPACEALLGPLLTRENRLAGITYNRQVGSSLLAAIRKTFVVPDTGSLEEVFSYNGEILDLFWSRSYLTRGRIDDEALEESLRASLGYLRNFLPEYLPKRTTEPEASRVTG